MSARSEMSMSWLRHKFEAQQKDKKAYFHSIHLRDRDRWTLTLGTLT